MNKTPILLALIGITVAALWWANFYLDFARATGVLNTAEDLMKLVEVYGDCAFFDRSQCLKVQNDATLRGQTVYQPYLMWFSLGMLAGGAVTLVQQAWHDPALTRGHG